MATGQKTEKTVRQAGRIAGTAIFLLFLLAPTADRIFGLDPSPAPVEKRGLEQLPGQVHISRFPQAFTAWLRDHFGFRNSLIRLHNRIKVRWLETSTVPTIAMGREKWLFLRQEQQVQDYRRRARLTEEELERWRRALVGRREWLAARGIRYLFTVSPDKASIYPEMMPDWLRPAQGPSRIEQLMAWLEEKSDFRLHYPREALLARKGEGLLYFRTDSHWNHLGAYHAYRDLMQRVARLLPGKAPHPLEIYLPRESRHRGDLALGLGLENIGREPSRTLVLPEACRPGLREGCEPPFSPRRPQAAVTLTDGPPGTKHRLLVFHDSFGEYLILNLASHFAVASFAGNPPKDPGWFRRYVDLAEHPKALGAKPDLVIEQRVERNLHDIPDWP